MPHTLSAAAAAVNNKREANRTRDLVIITLPASGSEPAVTIRLSTGVVPAIEGNSYLPALRSMPLISYSAGGDADGGEFEIENYSNTFGPVFINGNRSIDGAEAVIIRAFRLANGTWEVKNPATNEYYELGRGRVSTQPISKKAVKLLWTSDFSDSSIEVGNTPITQSCAKVFNVNGNHPLGGPCGYQPSQGGDPLVCDFTPDGPKGCKSKNNMHRYGGVIPLTPVSSTIATGNPRIPAIDPTGGYGDDGFPDRRNPRFDPDVRDPFIY